MFNLLENFFEEFIPPCHELVPHLVECSKKIPSNSNNTMGGKISKARRACMTEKTLDASANGDITGTSLGAGVKVSKSYDTKCVQDMLSGSK